MHPSDIRIGQTELSVHELYGMMQDKRLVLGSTPRKWRVENQSISIESILLGLTMTPFYVDAALPDQWLVLDGGKRLDALSKFLSGKLKLKGLEFLYELDGCSFTELPLSIQRKLLQSTFQVYSINQGIPPEVRLSLIRRIVPDYKKGLGSKMQERLLSIKARHLIEDMLCAEITSKRIYPKKEDLNVKVNYLQNLYTYFRNERFCEYNEGSSQEDVIIWTNRFVKSESLFIIEVWLKGLHLSIKLLSNNDIKEFKLFIRNNISVFILFFGATVRELDYQQFQDKEQLKLFVWRMADYFHGPDRKSHFIKDTISNKINTLNKLLHNTIEKDDH